MDLKDNDALNSAGKKNVMIDFLQHVKSWVVFKQKKT
jgi:hypothetical protein